MDHAPFSADSAALEAILARVRQLPADVPQLIALDGPCGSGKTTLADALAKHLNAPVVHMDDFCIPHAQKTPERLAIPGGNADVARLTQEVLAPFLARAPIVYRRYLCHEDALSAPVTLPPTSLLLLEGSYSLLPEIRQHVSLAIFLQISPALQQERLLQRVGSQRLMDFNRRWIPLESCYFRAFQLPDADCLLLSADHLQSVNAPTLP